MRRRGREPAKALGTGWHVASYLVVLLVGLVAAWWFWSGTASAAPAQEEDVVEVVHDPVAVVNDVVGAVSHEVERSPAAPVVQIVEPVAAPVVEPVAEAVAPVTDKIGGVVEPLADAVPPIPDPPPPPVPGASVVPPAGVVPSPVSVLDAVSPTSPIAVQATFVVASEARAMARVSEATTELQRGRVGQSPTPALAATAPAVSDGGATGPTGSTGGPVGPASLATLALPSGGSGLPDDGPRLLAVMALAAAAAWAVSRLVTPAVVLASAGAPRPSVTPD